MTPVKRKLAAILSADVQGYSHLMEEDEEETIRTLKSYMEVISGFIQQHRGHLVATGGDSVLATYIQMGQEREARAEAAEVLRINPKFTLDNYAKGVAFSFPDQLDLDDYIDSLHKAGLK
jgi:class 3 adenylate cyclase